MLQRGKGNSIPFRNWEKSLRPNYPTASVLSFFSKLYCTSVHISAPQCRLFRHTKHIRTTTSSSRHAQAARHHQSSASESLCITRARNGGDDGRAEVHGAEEAGGAGSAGGADAAGAEAALGHRRPGRAAVPHPRHPVLPPERADGGAGPRAGDPGRDREGARALLPVRREAQGARGAQARRGVHRRGRAVYRGRDGRPARPLWGRAAAAVPVPRGAHLRRPRLVRGPRLAAPPLPGDAAGVRGFHPGGEAAPHDGGRAGAGAVPGRRGGAGTGRGGADGAAGVGTRAAGGARPAAAAVRAPRVRRGAGHQGHHHPARRHGAPLLLLRAPGYRGRPRPPPTAPPLAGLHVRPPHGPPVEVPHGGAGPGRRRGDADDLHRERPRRQVRGRHPGGLLRQRVRVPGGRRHGRGPRREPPGLRRGAGEAGQGRGERGVHAIGGGPDGAARAAALHGGARVPGVGRDQGRVRRPGLRVGQAGVRRPREGRRGRHPRGGQLPHPVQERQGRGRHRRAHVPARTGHGDVRAGDGQAAEPARGAGRVPRHQVRAVSRVISRRRFRFVLYIISCRAWVVGERS